MESLHLAWLFYYTLKTFFDSSLAFCSSRICTFLDLREKCQKESACMYSFLREKSVFDDGVFMGVSKL